MTLEYIIILVFALLILIGIVRLAKNRKIANTVRYTNLEEGDFSVISYCVQSARRV